MPPLKKVKQGFRHEVGVASEHLGPHQDTRRLPLYSAPEGGKQGFRHEVGVASEHLGPHQDTRRLPLYSAPEGGKTGI